MKALIFPKVQQAPDTMKHRVSKGEAETETLRLQREFQGVREGFLCIGWCESGFGCHAYVIKMAGRGSETTVSPFRKDTLDILETDCFQRQFETKGLLFHDKSLLPSPAQLSPLLRLSQLHSGEVNTMILRSQMAPPALLRE